MARGYSVTTYSNQDRESFVVHVQRTHQKARGIGAMRPAIDRIEMKARELETAAMTAIPIPSICSLTSSEPDPSESRKPEGPRLPLLITPRSLLKAAIGGEASETVQMPYEFNQVSSNMRQKHLWSYMVQEGGEDMRSSRQGTEQE